MRWRRTLIGLLIFAILGLMLGLITVIISQRKWKEPPIPFPPPTPPFKNFVVGMGRVKASSRNISIGVPYGEIVKKIFVVEGEVLKEGDPLFALEDKQLLANLEVAKAAYAIAEATYLRALSLPRPEDVPPLMDAVNAAEANYTNFQKQFEFYDKISDPDAIAQIDYSIRKYTALQAKHQLTQSEDNLLLLKAGAWIKDLDITRASMKEAEEQVRSLQVNLERSYIRAPCDGTVLQINLGEGEYAQPFSSPSLVQTPLLVFGVLTPLRIWVDIDEEEIWRVIPDAQAIAYVRGNSSLCIGLKYLRIQPLVIPKPLFTGDNSERTDTRVLEIIYEFDKQDLPIYPGQVMDVYLEAKPFPSS